MTRVVVWQSRRNTRDRAWTTFSVEPGDLTEAVEAAARLGF